MSLKDIKSRGKWSSDLSVRRYEKHSTILRQLAKLSSAQHRDVAKASKALPALLRKLAQFATS